MYNLNHMRYSKIPFFFPIDILEVVVLRAREHNSVVDDKYAKRKTVLVVKKK